MTFIILFMITVMLEGSTECLPLPDVQQAVSKGVKHAMAIVKEISDMAQKYGKPKRKLPEPQTLSSEVISTLNRYYEH